MIESLYLKIYSSYYYFASFDRAKHPPSNLYRGTSSYCFDRIYSWRLKWNDIARPKFHMSHHCWLDRDSYITTHDHCNDLNYHTCFLFWHWYFAGYAKLLQAHNYAYSRWTLYTWIFKAGLSVNLWSYGDPENVLPMKADWVYFELWTGMTLLNS